VIANQQIIDAINKQIGNEFSAMLQYYAIAAHFTAEALPELSAHFREQAEEEKEHAVRYIGFVVDAGARVNIPAIPAPRSHFKAAEDAVKLSLEQEKRVSTQVSALVTMAQAAHFMDDFKSSSESDYAAENFLQGFVKEQLQEVALLEQLLQVIQRAGEKDLVFVEEHLASQKGREVESEPKKDWPLQSPDSDPL